MGQTLTHGIYLPDEGERNCYNGLAGNWQLLDGAVGTVAEHTTALAGKAPAVHTHTKSDITDFPAYGTTAGTICEGNDSRLSDARTPVAHTHTKSDVTDLFNSANTWTALNSYNQSIQITANFNIGAVPSSEVYGGFNFGNGTVNIGTVTSCVNSGGTTYSRLYIGNRFANRALDPDGTWKAAELQVGLKANGNRFIYTNAFWSNSLTPDTSNTYDLGSSSYQWNNLYAKNYYYNGTSWGLDQANVWNTYQTIKGYYLGSEQSTNGRTCIYLTSNRDTVGQSGIYITKFRQNRVQGGLQTADLHYLSFDVLENSIRTNGALQLNITGWNNDVPSGAILFSNLSNAHLGSSLIPWKTLNGINPGALSLPRGYTEEGADKDYINIASVIQTLDGTLYNYTMPDNGWICIRAEQATQVHVTIQSWYFGQSITHPTGSTLIVSVPFRKNDQISLKVKAVTLQYARFYPMQGNV